MLATTKQIVEGLDTVPHTNQRVFDFCAMKRHHGQVGVIVVVLDQQDHLLFGRHCNSPSVKKKVAPSPTAALAQIRPPCRATILCTVASPIPVPSNSESWCSLWNG